MIGGPDAGATNYDRCQEYVATKQDSVMCSFTKSGYFMPFHTHTSEQIGTSGGGARTLKRCQEYMSSKKGDIMCSYNSSGSFTLYHTKTGWTLGTNEGGAKTLDRCLEYMATERDGYVCSYDGKRFQIWDIYTGDQVSRGGFKKLRDCRLSLNDGRF